MKVGDLITLLRAYPNDDEIEIQVFECKFRPNGVAIPK